MRKELKILSVLALSLSGPLVYGQIKGTVQESNGDPAMGAKVEIKGTDTFTRTNDDGEFELSTAKVGDVLVITNLDDESKEVTATENLVFKFVKAQQAKKETDIEAVTIIGSIKVDPSQQIGSVATVKSEALASTPLASVNEVLDGRMAGVSFSGGGGQPGAITNITIRGVNSFTGSSNPLYVIDGVPVGKGTDPSELLSGYASFSPLAGLDPNSIESVTVLKDAAGTSLYGAQGANGVIIIKTKSGKYNQKTKFSFTTETGYQDVAFDKHKWMSSQEYVKWGGLTYAGADYQNGILDAYSNLDQYSQQFASDLGWDGVTNTNWAKEAQRKSSVVTQYSFNVNGGGENTSFNLGASYYKNDPLIKNSKFDRTSANVGLNHRASDKLSFNFNGSISHVKTDTYSGGGSYSNPWAAGWSMLPIYPVYNEDGSFNVRNLGSNEYFNTVELLYSDFLRGQMTTFLGSIGMDYDFAKNWKFTSSFATQYQNTQEQSWWNQHTGNARTRNGLLQVNDGKIFDYDWNNFVQYQKKFAEKHDLTLSAGVDYQEHTKRYHYSAVSGFPEYSKPELSNGSNPLSLGGGKHTWTQISYIGRLAYTFDRKYTITGNYRRDGNSTFGDDNKWGDFWNAGVMWNVSNEEFLSGNTVINSLKVRGNYGISGNTPMTEWDKIFMYRALLEGKTYSDGNAPAFNISSAGNPELKWEQSKQLDLGVDFGLLNNRITGSFDFYNRKTDDLISVVQLPTTTGGPNQTYANLGAVRNRGIELSLTGVPVKTADFYWSVTGTAAYNKSKVMETVEEGVSGIAYNKAMEKGKQVGEYYTWTWAGVNSNTGAGIWYANNPELQKEYDAYSQVEKDALKDQLYYNEKGELVTTNKGQAKREFQGSTPFPVWQATLLNELSYKGFRLSFLFSGSFNYKVYDGYTTYFMSDGAYAGAMNQDRDLLYNSWTPDNTNAANPIQVYDNPGNSYSASSRFLRKGDHIRLKDVKLSYTFGKEFLGENIGIDAVTIYVRGTNLITWAFDSKLKSDPDSYSTQPRTNGYADFYGRGYYDFSSPVMRTYSFGINVNF